MDEYTDYSCSTPLERLARDVETHLRAWHVHDSDRHVSFSSHSSSEQTTTTTTTAAAAAAAATTTTARERHESSSSSVGTVTSGQSSLMIQPEQPSAVKLIRSNSVTYTASLRTKQRPSTTINIPLLLCLWDGAVIHPTEEESTAGEQEISNLPLSLQQVHHNRDCLLPSQHISSWFGIGQHITLTPKNDEARKDLLSCSLGNKGEHVLQELHSYTNMLQTALNIAVVHCECRIPVFGMVGLYLQQQQEKESARKHQRVVPKVFTGGIPLDDEDVEQEGTSRRQLYSRKRVVTNISYLPPALYGRLLQKDGGMAHFVMHMIPPHVASIPPHLTTLNGLGQLLAQWAENNKNPVVVCAARHEYVWKRPPKNTGWTSTASGILLFADDDDVDMEWRRVAIEEPESGGDSNSSEDSAQLYMNKCRRYASRVLQEGWSSSLEPLWGPAEDPLLSVRVSCTWDFVGADRCTPTPPVLPLRIRSHHSLTPADVHELEQSMQNAIMNPLDSRPFSATVKWDEPSSTLSATCRCVLAALLRTSSLQPDTLLGHMTQLSVLREWAAIAAESEEEDEERSYSNRNNLNPHPRYMKSLTGLTQNLVNVMDWASMAEAAEKPDTLSMMVNRILGRVMDGSIGLGFPSEPSSFSGSKGVNVEGANMSVASTVAPMGRLLTLLFVQMASLRTPSAMAVLWTAFVEELRGRWDLLQSLPNLNFVAALDPQPSAEDRTLSKKNTFAANVDSSEPEPDLRHVIIGQKLQVFNIGVECQLSELKAAQGYEAQPGNGNEDEIFGLDKNHDTNNNENEDDDTPSMAATTEEAIVAQQQDEVIKDDESHAVSVNTEDMVPGDSPQRLGALGNFLNGVKNVPGNSDVCSSTSDHRTEYLTAVVDLPEDKNKLLNKDTSVNTTAEFFDAVGEEGGEENDAKEEGHQCIPCEDIARILENVGTVASLQTRRGARCPVFGISLVASGDQLYAPYLRREPPLTEDLLSERRALLSRRNHMVGGKTVNKTELLQSRIDLAHRLQRPKLLSDMRAFMAANPGAVFQDFAKWHGNPGNPLEDCEKTEHIWLQPSEAIEHSYATKLSDASEAIQILNATRTFWSETWEEATPCPASEQPPLFDASATVEKILHDLETIHPAVLICQVMAVNFSIANFVLRVSAEGEALKVQSSQKALQRLQDKTADAERRLSNDVKKCTAVGVAHRKRLGSYVSLETVEACEAACNAIAEVEHILSRIISLLHKFPGEYDLVEKMLHLQKGSSISVESAGARAAVLSSIRKQQEHNYDDLPRTSVREYVLRNLEEHSPCQMSVRIGGNPSYTARSTDEIGGLVVALTKCGDADE